jgi:probable phosphoglycerate mutase
MPMDKKSKIITVVRHGETEWNRKGIQQGHLDSPLSETGVKQAKLLSLHLKNEKYEVIHTSSLGRAIQTAIIINESLNLEIIKHDDLREMNLGIMQGLTKIEFQNNYPDEYEKFSYNDPEYVIPGGESLRQQYERTIRFMKFIATSTKYSKILVITHGGNLEIIFKYVLGIPLDKEQNFSAYNSCLNTFKYEDGKWHLLTWGDISPLKSLDVLDDF